MTTQVFSMAEVEQLKKRLLPTSLQQIAIEVNKQIEDAIRNQQQRIAFMCERWTPAVVQKLKAELLAAGYKVKNSKTDIYNERLLIISWT